MSFDADVIVVGAGLSGLVATAELADAGRRVIVVEQEPEASMGGQAFWSLGGLFLVDSPEQRRSGVKDSYELALSDWVGIADFEDADVWPRRWAEQYIARSRDDVGGWLKSHGVRFFPVVNWAERGVYGDGNSVPRFHLTWGCGKGLVDAMWQAIERHPNRREKLEVRFRTRVTELVTGDGGAIRYADFLERLSLYGLAPQDSAEEEMLAEVLRSLQLLEKYSDTGEAMYVQHFL